MIQTYAIALIVGIAALSGSWLHGNSTGKESVKAEYNQATLELQNKSRKLADELEREKRKVKVRTVETIKEIKVASDPSGCLDATIDDRLLEMVDNPAS